jgi:hypothetical protein
MELRKFYRKNDRPEKPLNELIKKARLPNVYLLKYTSITEDLVAGQALSALDRIGRLLDGLPLAFRGKVSKFRDQGLVMEELNKQLAEVTLKAEKGTERHAFQMVAGSRSVRVPRCIGVTLQNILCAYTECSSFVEAMIHRKHQTKQEESSHSRQNWRRDACRVWMWRNEKPPWTPLILVYLRPVILPSAGQSSH